MAGIRNARAWERHAWCRLSRMQDPVEATEHHGPARKFLFLSF